jgi:hypothetical protein
LIRQIAEMRLPSAIEDVLPSAVHALDAIDE